MRGRRRDRPLHNRAPEPARFRGGLGSWKVATAKVTMTPYRTHFFCNSCRKFRHRTRFKVSRHRCGDCTPKLTARDFETARERVKAVESEDVIISTDLKLRLDGLPYSSQKEPDDPGASVWWRPAGATQDRVIACDQYDRIADNIYAIGKTLEAMRGIERWGGGEILERTFTGFTALPPPDQAGGRDPHEVIGCDPSETIEIKRMQYRKALSVAHPDKGGTPDRFRAVKEAGRALGL